MHQSLSFPLPPPFLGHLFDMIHFRVFCLAISPPSKDMAKSCPQKLPLLGSPKSQAKPIFDSFIRKKPLESKDTRPKRQCFSYQKMRAINQRRCFNLEGRKEGREQSQFCKLFQTFFFLLRLKECVFWYNSVVLQSRVP